MRKPWIIRMVLLIGYCIPYAFLSVAGDTVSGTMSFYGFMIAGFSLLCWCALKTNNVAVLYIGNLLSIISSYASVILYGLEPMGDYFKPFTSHSMIAVISVAAVIVQTVIVLFDEARKKKTVI